jgi:hypothetical protein
MGRNCSAMSTSSVNSDNMSGHPAQSNRSAPSSRWAKDEGLLSALPFPLSHLRMQPVIRRAKKQAEVAGISPRPPEPRSLPPKGAQWSGACRGALKHPIAQSPTPPEPGAPGGDQSKNGPKCPRRPRQKLSDKRLTCRPLSAKSRRLTMVIKKLHFDLSSASSRSCQAAAMTAAPLVWEGPCPNALPT